MTREELLRAVRRLLAEASAVVDEWKEAATRPGRTFPRSMTYGEGLLTVSAPMLIAYMDACRDGLDELDDEELVTLRDEVTPVVELRRLARAANDAKRREGGT